MIEIAFVIANGPPLRLASDGANLHAECIYDAAQDRGRDCPLIGDNFPSVTKQNSKPTARRHWPLP